MKPARYTRRRDTRAASPEIGRAAVAPPGSIPPGGGLATPKKKRGSPEASFQVQAVAYLRLVLPQPCRVWHVPNRHIPGLPPKVAQMVGAALKRMGLLAGVHDINAIVPGGFFTIECKAGRGSLTDGQEEFADAMTACGHPWFEARTLEQVAAIAALVAKRYGLTLRPVVITPSGVLWTHEP